MRKHFNYVWGGLLGAIGITGSASAAETETTPNIVFIYMDDMGYADLSCYGETRWQTTHIDALAENGMRFTDFYSASPVSSPSRAGLLTGRYPIRMGIQGVFYPDSYTGLPQEEVTIAEILKTKGYATSCIGKWHLGSREKFLPLAHGFDEYFGIPYSNDMGAQVYLRNNDVETFHIDIDNVTQKYTEEAVSFIRRNADRPFFLFLSHTMVHVPIYVSGEFVGKSGAGIYGDAVLETDWSVGKIMETLRSLGLEENTIVVFTSDNGPWLQEGPLGGRATPLREGKTTAFEGGVRVPCIVYWKNKIQSAVNREVATMLDWLPTLTSIAGAELPDVRLDGYDITAALKGTGQRESQDYAYYRNNREVTDYRSGDWKISLPAPAIKGNYWRTTTAAHDTLLFNLREDVGEQYNLYHKYPEKVKEMTDKLQAFVDNFGEIPPPLVMTGNNASPYLREQRRQAVSDSIAVRPEELGLKTDDFINMK